MDEEFSRKGIKRASRQLIKGNFLSLYAANFLIELIIGFTALLKDYLIFSVIILVFTCVFEFGLAAFYLEFVHNKNMDYRTLLVSYRTNSIKRFLLHLGTYVVKYVIIIVFASLLLIPGLIKRYSYSQVKFVRADNPDMGITKCLLISKKMMKWHKTELFVLEISIFIWFLLSPLTGGLILLYLIPYYSTVMARYHLYVKNRYELKKDINRSLRYNFVQNLRRII